MTLRRILACVVMVASLVIGLGSSAAGGEICVQYDPYDPLDLGLHRVKVCVPTNV